jgi:soluble cytochrome b562
MSDLSDRSDNFKVVDLTDELAAKHSEIEKNIAIMKDILQHSEPATPTGQHCLEPYACPYQHYCAQGIRQMSLF